MSNLIPDTTYIYSGTTTLASGTSIVSFTNSLPDANYQVFLTGNANERFYFSAKDVTGFTVNSSNTSSTAIVDWIIKSV